MIVYIGMREVDVYAEISGGELSGYQQVASGNNLSRTKVSLGYVDQR